MEIVAVNTLRYGTIAAMARKATGKVRQGERMLTASDWAEAALQLIAEKGLSALTVSTLSARLAVTKGSFYWHFTGRSDLLAAALSRWETTATTETIRALDAVEDPRTRLELILHASTQPPRARSLYAALAEAAEDPVVHAALERVASARIAYLRDCYTRLGFDATRATSHAVFSYAAYRGLLQLAHEAPTTLPTDWAAYGELIRDTFVPPAPAKSAKRKAGPRAT